MQEIPRACLPSQVVQENADPEPAILARVYALILTWSQEEMSTSGQTTEANAPQSGTDGDDHQDGATEGSTFKTE